MFKIITEGRTRLYVPVEGSFGRRVSGRDRKPPVFYNPHMALNRGLCVLFMKTAGRGLVFADVLAGSGAKGLRVAVEAGNSVFLNDANPDAVGVIKKNAELNAIDVQISNLDGNAFLLENKGCFGFIDIDPFGSPVPFIDSSLLSSKDGGYIGVTATDTAALCGVYPSTCMRRYQAAPLRNEFCHEVGLRILIGFLVRSAAKYDRGYRPVLSHSTRHYFRVYGQLRERVRNADESLEQTGYLYYCPKCMDYNFESSLLPSARSCTCGDEMKFAGPMWFGDLHDRSRIKKMLTYSEGGDGHKLLETLYVELTIPFYYDVHVLAKAVRKSPIKIEAIIERLKEGGFRAGRTHFLPTGIKSDAPVEEVKKRLS